MITLTDGARSHLARLLSSHGRPDAALRVYVMPGGCSGLSYGMSLEDEPDEDDHVIDYAGVKVVVDPFSAPHVQGAQIDYVDELMGGGLKVLNPNAVRSCSCGHSFDTGASAGSAKPCH